MIILLLTKNKISDKVKSNFVATNNRKQVHAIKYLQNKSNNK